MSGLLMVLCPLGMVAMGGVAWVVTRLPGKRAERIAQVARHATCLPVAPARSPARPPKAHLTRVASTRSQNVSEPTSQAAQPEGKSRSHPVFARVYGRVAEIGERRGGAEHRQMLLAGLSARVVEVGAGV
jgi:hypothetical protein